MASSPVSLLALERAWFDASTKRATGGRHALAGFSYQLALSLKAFFGRVVDEDSTATLAFDGLSDLAEFQGELVYLTQIKRTLNRESQKSAVAEFLEIDRFLERDYSAFRDRVCFCVICGRRGAGLDEAWDPGRLGLADDEARRWHQIREKRFSGYHVEGDPKLELAIQLWKTVPRPYDFVNACIAKLQHLLGLNRGSDEIAAALFQDLQNATVHEKIVGTLLGPRDFERTDTPSNRILIGQRPRLADLREGCFMERAGRVRSILDRLDRAIPLDSPLREGGRKVPVVWISGGSGVGKSALLLQSLRELVCAYDQPVIYLEHFAQELPKAIERIGPRRAVIAADDLYAPDQRASTDWNEVNRLAHGAPNITILACAPDESREAFAELAHRHGVLAVSKVDVPLLTGKEQGEYFQWFCQRTGATDLQSRVQANFVLAAFTLDCARHGDPSIEEFAARFKQRLEAREVYEVMLRTLAVNRLGIQPPVSFFSGAQDALRALKNEGLVSLNQDSDGKLSVLFHAAIGRRLYDIYRPERSCGEARAQDIAAYFKAVSEDHKRALSLISLLRGGQKTRQPISERLAIEALAKIWGVLLEDEPPALKIKLLLECKKAIHNRNLKALKEVIEPHRILRWMDSLNVNAEGWGVLLQIVWEVLPPDKQAVVHRRAVAWLKEHFHLAPWHYVWQLLWEARFEKGKLVDLAQRWLESHIEDEAWNFVFQPLVDSDVRGDWLLDNARQALARGRPTRADIRVWEKVKRLGLNERELAFLLLTRLCKSLSPYIRSEGVQRFSALRRAVDPVLLAGIFDTYPEEPGSPHTFINLCPFIAGRQDAIQQDLLPAALCWLTGREDRPEWSHVWEALLKLAPGDASLHAQGRDWLKTHGDRPEWSYVWQALVKLTPGDASLHAQGREWLTGREDGPEWSHVWEALLKLTPDDASLHAQGREWLKTRGDRPEWSYVWQALVKLTPDDASLHAQGREWLKTRGDRPEWGYVWQALVKLAPGDASLHAQGREWLTGREDGPQWSHVWEALLKLTPDDAPLHAQGREWLKTRADRPKWAFVWQALLKLTPDDASLRAQGREWLQGREDRPEWAFVWQALLKLTPDDASLRAQGREWLQGREDRPEWNYVWRELLDLTPADAALQAQGRAWLQDREDRPKWSDVWQALLKSPPDGTKLRELLELGAAWCRNREDRIEYPYVEREIKTRAARYWRELPQSERGALLQELIVQWTHDSTAIEGNTLSLGETKAVIEHGLTISGKPLKDHHEVIGHKRALDLVFTWSGRSALRFDDLFDLHRAVLMEAIFDIMQPIGAWKVEKNRVRVKTRDGRIVYIEFADPAQVSTLMECWLNRLNHWLGDPPDDADSALSAFVDLHVGFVRVHPFFDGNGRMARLLANLPLLKAGFPPLIVPEQKREEYKVLHTEYDLAVGRVGSPPQLSPQHELLREIRRFCRDAWQPTLDMVAARVFRDWMR